jgi:hypothetical protein
MTGATLLDRMQPSRASIGMSAAPHTRKLHRREQSLSLRCRFIDHNSHSPNGSTAAFAIISESLPNGGPNLFLTSNLAGPFGDVLITLFQSYPYLHRKAPTAGLRRIRRKAVTDLMVRPSGAADLSNHTAAAMAALHVCQGNWPPRGASRGPGLVPAMMLVRLDRCHVVVPSFGLRFAALES